METTNIQERGIELAMTVKWPKELPTTMSYFSAYPDEKLENIITGFISCLVGHTWTYETVINGLRDYLEEYTPQYNDENQED